MNAEIKATLTEANLEEGVAWLVKVDPDLAQVVARHGPPPLWARQAGFPTLVHIILEQQVSLASARAAYEKLLLAAGNLSPERFLAFSAEELKTIGFSRQKTAYCRGLAEQIVAGHFDMAQLAEMEDGRARACLMALKGVGPWTADIYLLMALLRPDIWPAGDLALVSAMRSVKRLPERPKPDEMTELALPWRPFRAVAARILWHAYLSGYPDK